ncbi:MAG: PLP-dependent transferase, partial [Pseudomonadota bacterium]
LGGVILGTREFIRKTVEPYMKHTGGALSPLNAWIMVKGLETMALRVNAQADTALKIAEALRDHPALSRMLYPGLKTHTQNALVQRQLGGKGGTVLSLDLKGGKTAAFKFLNTMSIPVISNNLGDAKSIATHPATTTHQRLSDDQRDTLGITPGLVRFSVGLEGAEDLIADLAHALDVAHSS